ncbi:unnamed protein product [Rotaria sp. Silwood2]|nr:unnamed protein product [Rotaria sp. Silwood2]
MFYCHEHYLQHREDLNRQLEILSNERNSLMNKIEQQKAEPQQHALMKKIDEWEHDSIAKIQQVAKEAKQTLLSHIDEFFPKVEQRMSPLTDELCQKSNKHTFVDTDITKWKQELEELKTLLDNPSDLKVQEDSTPLVTKIKVTILSSLRSNSTDIHLNAKWIENGLTVAGGNKAGSEINQLHYPLGLYVDDDNTIYVADFSNHRIVEWRCGATNGQVIAGGNGSGNGAHQLSNPRDVIVDKERDSLIICDCNNKRIVRWSRRNGTSGETIISNISCYGLTMDESGSLYITDYEKHEVRRYKIGNTEGIVVAGGNGKGNRLDQLSDPRYVFVDRDHSVYVSEEGNHRVMKWEEGAKQGIVVAGGQGSGNSLTQLSRPFGVAVDQLSTVYVTDLGNNRIMRWPKGTTQGSVIAGGNGSGVQSNQLNSPVGLSFDRHGNLYVADQYNHRVQKFNTK